MMIPINQDNNMLNNNFLNRLNDLDNRIRKLEQRIARLENENLKNNVNYNEPDNSLYMI